MVSKSYDGHFLVGSIFWHWELGSCHIFNTLDRTFY